MSKNYLISVDFGGTKILTALLDSKHKIVARLKVATDASKGKMFMIKTLAGAIQKILEEAKLKEADIKAICIGIPGSVNPYTGEIGIAPNLGITKFNFREAIAKYFSIPVLIENDVNLGALGVVNFELKGQGKNAMFVFVGTGIGGALFFDGKIYRGSNNFAGEIGHMIVQPNGPVCGCGKKGCFEAIAGRLAIVREIKKDLKKKPKGVLKQYALNKKQIKSKALAAAVKKNDPIALKHVDNACRVIGQTLASVTTLLNLDLIVLGGGVVEAIGKYMLPKIKSSFKEYVMKDSGKDVKIINTALGDDAAIYGGIALAEEFKGLLN